MLQGPLAVQAEEILRSRQDTHLLIKIPRSCLKNTGKEPSQGRNCGWKDAPGWQKTAALFLFFKVQASLEPTQKKSQHNQVRVAEVEVPLENTGDNWF